MGPAQAAIAIAGGIPPAAPASPGAVDARALCCSAGAASGAFEVDAVSQPPLLASKRGGGRTALVDAARRPRSDSQGRNTLYYRLKRAFAGRLAAGVRLRGPPPRASPAPQRGGRCRLPARLPAKKAQRNHQPQRSRDPRRSRPCASCRSRAAARAHSHKEAHKEPPCARRVVGFEHGRPRPPLHAVAVPARSRR
jgi:hypothetical protein